MSRTVNTDPFEVQAREANKNERDVWTWRDGTVEVFHRHPGGTWANKGWLARWRNRQRRQQERELIATADPDAVVMPEKHRHSARWDMG